MQFSFAGKRKKRNALQCRMLALREVIRKKKGRKRLGAFVRRLA